MQITAACVPLRPPAEQAWVWEPLYLADSVQDELPFEQAGTGPQRRPRRDEQVNRVCVHFAKLVVETIQGLRRLSQLALCFDDEALEVLARRLPLLRRDQARLGSVRAQTSTGHKAEITLRLATRTHDVAAAMSMSQDQSGWRCTALVIG